jgi:hypothetical protein
MLVHLLALLKMGAVYIKATFFNEFKRIPHDLVNCSRH